MIVILNNLAEDREIEVEVWQTGISRQEDTVLERVMLTYRAGYTEEKDSYIARGGIVRLNVPGYGAVILYHKDEEECE